jgi:hypothetical protein
VTATVTVINNSTANIGTGTKQIANGGFTVFKNISAPNGRFLQAGTHQIIARITSNNAQFKALASFNVIIR